MNYCDCSVDCFGPCRTCCEPCFPIP
jgi:hypothetical protein